MALKGIEDLIKKIRDDADMTAENVTEELNKLLPAEWIPKTTYNAQTEELKAAKKAKADTDALMKTLQEKAGLSDDYKTQIENLKAQQAQEKADFDKKIGQMKLDTAIEKALSGAKARNAAQCARLLDATKLQLNEDGTVSGLKEQVDALKTGSAYLFEAAEKDPADNEPTQPQAPSFGGGRGNSGTSTSRDHLMSIFGLSGKKD